MAGRSSFIVRLSTIDYRLSTVPYALLAVNLFLLEIPAVPNALLLSTDLFFASRIKAAAVAAGLEMSMGKSIEKVTLKDDLAFVVVDLATTGSEPDAIAQMVRSHSDQTRLVAFGPHVQTGRLDGARQAGFDAVLTRGQLDRQIGQLFQVESRQ